MDIANHKTTAMAWIVTNAATLALGYMGFIGNNAIAGSLFMLITWLAISFGALMIAISAATNTLPQTRTPRHREAQL